MNDLFGRQSPGNLRAVLDRLHLEVFELRRAVVDQTQTGEAPPPWLLIEVMGLMNGLDMILHRGMPCEDDCSLS